MKNSVKVFSILFLMLVLLGVNGCSRFFAPSDEAVIKAISEMKAFSGDGPAKMTLTAPPVVEEKIKKDGAWQVKVKLTFTYKMADGKEAAPIVRSPIFRISKVKGDDGKDVWKAEQGS